uniref:Disease resistance R13L4/SHOC-2-like LRR domain-containing protein n=1 Tax=Oryza barthii TaxID=65489 RepID=A0A0D3HCW0_9ORYZ
MPPCMIRSRRCTRAMLIVEKGDDEEIQQLMVVRGIINNSSKIFRVVKFCCKAIRVLNRAFEMYFVVIDDMSAERWCDIEPAFPVDDGISITIVVTTNIQSIDNACSTADGYVYKMGNSTLNIRKICSSKVLLLRIVHQTWREAQNNFGRNSMEYKLLQVLDLEECDGFMDGYLDSICKLLLLKYVSIGGAVTTLLKTIAGLKLLETLDFRRNKVEVVIISVEAVYQIKYKKKIEPGKSNLQILAGFIAANNHGFVKLMCHMKNLRKVNIWCKSVTKGNKLNSLSIAIEKFIESSNDPNDARTLSVDFSECSEDILQISI